MDLARWYADGRVAALIDLIDELPSSSRFNEAISNDREFAEQLAELPKPDREWAPRLAEYDLTAHLLTSIQDQLGALISATIAAAGGKPGKAKPAARPRTEIEAARDRRERKLGAELASRFGFAEDM